ncbi:MAG: DUF4280 domain-containing protein [Acidaminobacteraceae bacterium]
MGYAVVNGAMLKCSFGAAPSTFNVLPVSKVFMVMPAANIMDNKAMLNIMPFGVCNSIANPQVAAATAAALGVLTPQPCIPNVVAPWVPGSPTVLIAGKPALNNSCKVMCMWAGVIEVVNPGQTTVMIP